MKRYLFAIAMLLSMTGLGALDRTATASTSYHWGNPPDVCSMLLKPQSYDCTIAITPYQTVKASTSLQYLVPCSDAPVPQSESIAYLTGTSIGGSPDTVAWYSGSNYVSGEKATAAPTYSTSPVKVYYTSLSGSTSVQFAAGCQYLKPCPPGGCWGDSSVDRAGQLERDIRRTRAEFASGKRVREEFETVVITDGGVALHERRNLQARVLDRQVLMCPAGMVRDGEPQVSYGLESRKDPGDHLPKVRMTQELGERGATLSFRPERLRYPTSVYVVLSCASEE